VALAECCVAGGVGADIHLGEELAPVAELFSETQGRVVATCPEADIEALLKLLDRHGVPYGVVGTLGGERLRVEGMVDVSLDQLREAYEPTLERLVHGNEELQSEELSAGPPTA
jgi:phosphoribosylformylglycinamidine synthase